MKEIVRTEQTGTSREDGKKNSRNGSERESTVRSGMKDGTSPMHAANNKIAG